VVTVEKGHGRLERRAIRTNAELKDYLSFPGMEQVGEVKKRVRFLKRGEEKETTHYFVTSLSPQQAGPAPLLGVFAATGGLRAAGSTSRTTASAKIAMSSVPIGAPP
jgi:hypothetical protein